MLNSSDVKKFNINRIRSEMWKGGEHTKQSLARCTDLSIATCNTLLNELERAGEIMGEKRQINGVGRSTTVYKINEEYESILCLRYEPAENNDIFMTCVRLTMLGRNIYEDNGFISDFSIADVTGKISEMTNRFKNISCILVAVSGIVENGVIHLSDVPSLKGVNLLEEIRKKVNDIPVKVDYDCRFWAYGAYREADYEHETLTCINSIKNVLPGGASISNGTPIIGKNGFAGMSGYGDYSLSREEQIKRVAEGDADILLAKHAMNFIVTLNPDEIIFFGNVVTEKDLEKIRGYCEKYLPSYLLPKMRVETDVNKYFTIGMYYKAIEIKKELSLKH